MVPKDSSKFRSAAVLAALSSPTHGPVPLDTLHPKHPSPPPAAQTSKALWRKAGLAAAMVGGHAERTASSRERALAAANFRGKSVMPVKEVTGVKPPDAEAAHQNSIAHL